MESLKTPKPPHPQPLSHRERVAEGRVRRRVVLVGILAIFGSAKVLAQSAENTFKQANADYAAGQFQQAALLYETARAEGLHHWVLYYNLGNAYYKSGTLGKAIANYDRAFRINSHQRDVIYNLNLALTKAGDPLVPNEALAALFWKLFYGPSLDMLTVCTSVLFVSLCLGAGLLFQGRWRPSAEVTFGALLGILTLGSWLGMRIAAVQRLEAIVISGTAEVRSGPNLNYPANFTVPEGRRVLILDEQEPIKGWLEIGVPQEGLKGWVPDSAVEII